MPGDLFLVVALTAEHLQLACSTARAVRNRLPKRVCINPCDLESAAYFGLFQASLRYQHGVGSFEGYAKIRVLGSILDYLRSLDLVSRTTRKRIRLAKDAVKFELLYLGGEVAFLPSKDLGPEQLAIRQQETDRVKAATHLLSDREQTLLRMRHSENLTWEQIATSLGITPGRVSQIQQRAHNRLRDLLTPSKPLLYGRLCSARETNRVLPVSPSTATRR